MDQEPNAHCQTWELIPWVVNGTATAAQRERVEAHLRACADCREEFALQQQFHTAMLARPSAVPDPQPALARLFARLELQGDLTPAETPPRRRSRASTWLVAAVVVQAVGLGLLGAALLHRSGDATPAESGYRTLSSSAPGQAAVAIRLVAAPDMTLATLRQLLGDAGLRIVETNTDNSIFGLARIDAAKSANAEFIRVTLLRLRAQPGVLLAEPVGEAGRAP